MKFAVGPLNWQELFRHRELQDKPYQESPVTEDPRLTFTQVGLQAGGPHATPQVAPT